MGNNVIESWASCSEPVRIQECWNREDSSASILGEALSPHDVRDFTVFRIRMYRWLPALVATAPTGASRCVRSTETSARQWRRWSFAPLLQPWSAASLFVVTPLTVPRLPAQGRVSMRLRRVWIRLVTKRGPMVVRRAPRMGVAPPCKHGVLVVRDSAHRPRWVCERDSSPTGALGVRGRPCE